MRRTKALSAVLALVAGCGNSAQEDLHAWMRDQHAPVHSGVKPADEPEAFIAQTYTEAQVLDPYDSQKLTQALRREAGSTGISPLLAPELRRRKEALEVFPLDAMTLVGSMSRDGQSVALIRVDPLLHQVRIGDHLGLDHGRVIRIGDTELVLREIVQDSAGEWVERMTILRAQDKPEKQK